LRDVAISQAFHRRLSKWTGGNQILGWARRASEPPGYGRGLGPVPEPMP